MLTLDTTGEKQWAADLQVFLQFLAWSTIYIPFCNEEILVWAQGLAIIALTYYEPFPGLRTRFFKQKLTSLGISIHTYTWIFFSTSRMLFISKFHFRRENGSVSQMQSGISEAHHVAL